MVRAKAPAKINLSLDIVRKRPDGYHDVAMVLQSVSLYDYLEVDTVDGSGDEITISCDGYDVPLDGRNIVAKAARAFFEKTKVERKPLSIKIEKHIPTEAGLAGGSADGAATVLALNQLFETHLRMDEMSEIGAKVGADVPFCLLGGTMLATETGTTLKKLPAIPKCCFVIVKPDLSVSTGEAYAKADEKPKKDFLYTDEVVSRLYRRDIRGLSSCLFNEFEQVLSLDEINAIKKQMMAKKALGASMSGSGSAVYGIFLNEKKAKACAESLKETYEKVFFCTPTKLGCTIE